MNKRTIHTTLIIIGVLAIAFIYQPNINKTAINGLQLLIYDQIAPSKEIYQGDAAFFGGTIYNNRTETFRVTNIAADIYQYNTSAPNNHSFLITWVAHEVELSKDDIRYQIKQNEARTIFFSREMDLKVKDDYLLIIRVQYKNVNAGDDIIPYDYKIGENVTFNVNYRRPPAPTYVWAVLTILSAGILSIVIIGLVNWIREKRSK